jgi:hypothetical protein
MTIQKITQIIISILFLLMPFIIGVIELHI